MKIFDCTTFYNENLILEARFNILNEFVDKLNNELLSSNINKNNNPSLKI